MSSICLAGGGVIVKLAAAITLSWTHSVEKTRWEEDWRTHPAGIAIVESRVQGTGAGMEVPEGAKLKGKSFPSMIASVFSLRYANSGEPMMRKIYLNKEK